MRIRINLNFKEDTMMLTYVDEVSNKKTPLVSERRIPSYLKNEQLFLTMYAYNGAATIGDIQIREITVRESLKSIVENFDNEMQKINKKMINDLIHSHVMQKQNKSLLTVMINEEDIGLETKTIRKLSKILQKELQTKLYEQNGLREKATDSADYKSNYDTMLKQLSNMLNMQRKLHDKIRESNKFLQAIEQLDSVYKEIEYIQQFVAAAHPVQGHGRPDESARGPRHRFAAARPGAESGPGDLPRHGEEGRRERRSPHAQTPRKADGRLAVVRGLRPDRNER